MNKYLFEVGIEGEGEKLSYIGIVAPNLKKARKLFAEKMKKVTEREYWLFDVYRQIN